MHTYLAIPLLDELESLPQLLNDIDSQTENNFSVIFCVNQPDFWWYESEKRKICEANVDSLKILRNFAEKSKITTHIIDCCSQGKGWEKDHSGVGFARRKLMDYCTNLSQNEKDIILSVDGDTHFEKDHISKIQKTFIAFPHIGALSIPFFHYPQGNEIQQKSLLRYEMFLRYLLINLLRIESPYAYSAIGSAMACTVKAYKRIGGIVPKISGEDFYFMQQLRKTGMLIPWCKSIVYPSARVSDRVLFGTGLAVADIQSQKQRYHFYDIEAFNKIRNAALAFKIYYNKHDDISKQCILDIFPNIALDKLAKNHSSQERFVHACHEKADALAISKCLKRINSYKNTDTFNINKLSDIYPNYNWKKDFDFDNSKIEDYLCMRDCLFNLETDLLKSQYNKLLKISKNKKCLEWKYMI